MLHFRTIVIGVSFGLALSSFGQVAPMPPSPLDDLDTFFVPAYEARTAALNATHPPYVEVSGSSLFLHIGGKDPLKVRVLTDPYHHLKDVAHAPFTVYLSIVGLGSSALSDAQLTPIRALLTKLTAAEDALPSAGFDATQEMRQRVILDASIQFLNQILTNRTVDQMALGAYAHAMAPLMLNDAGEAGCFQILATHKQMMLWKPLLTQEEWQNLRVVIKNSHQARYRNADTQYFAWLLGGSSPPWSLPGESGRVLYAEALFGNQTGGDELLAVMVDFEASRAFFGDDWRMSEDIMSGGAARCLSQLSPADRIWSPANGGTQ